MPLLEQEKAIKLYFEEVKHKYPDVSFDRFREVCKFPFEYIKQCIRGNKLPKILVKYLGKFRTYPSRIKEQLKKEKIFFEKNIITEQEYTDKKNFLEKHLTDLYADMDKD